MKKTIILGLLLSFFQSQTIESMQCNGKAEYCNQPYNEVAEIMTHNSTTTDKHRLLGIIPNPVADQHNDQGDQLGDGIRAFKLPIHNKDGQAWIAHTLPQNEFENYTKKYVPFFLRSEISGKLWMIDATNMSLEVFLNQIKSFLQGNPQEVVTLLLNIFDGAQSLVPEAFAKSGIYKYMHAQSPADPWPTYEELIKSDERLIVFADEYIPADLTAKYPWINKFINTRDFFIENKYSYDTPEELKNDDCQLRKGQNIINRQPDNGISIVNHFVTSGAAGSPKVADIANGYDIVKNHMNTCIQLNGKKPKFLHVDFYDLHQDEMKRAIDEINAQ